MENWKDCTPKCRSSSHALWLMSALTKSSDDAENLLCLSKCCNAVTVCDDLGRTALHIAAACGRKEAISWISNSSRCNINTRDFCYGWTPLHYAVHYGQVESAVALIRSGADLFIKVCFHCFYHFSSIIYLGPELSNSI